MIQFLFFPTKDQTIPFIQKILNYENYEMFFSIEFIGLFEIEKESLPIIYLVGALERPYHLQVFYSELFQIDSSEFMDDIDNFKKTKFKLYFKHL
jgi:hypothetical protein